MASDSGVVTRMCGGCWLRRRRSAALVSPVRLATRIGTSSGLPPAQAGRKRSQISASGRSRLRCTSYPSARSGDTYTARSPSTSVPRSCSATSSESTARNAASVFPVPVGAEMSTCRRAWMSGIADSCGGVSTPKVVDTHSRTGAASSPSADVRRSSDAGAGSDPFGFRVFRVLFAVFAIRRAAVLLVHATGDGCRTAGRTVNGLSRQLTHTREHVDLRGRLVIAHSHDPWKAQRIPRVVTVGRLHDVEGDLEHDLGPDDVVAAAPLDGDRLESRRQ